MHDSVITFIANPQVLPLTEAFIQHLQSVLTAQGWRADADWLAPGVACDMHVAGGVAASLEALVLSGVADYPYDAVVQPAMGRRKRLLISDMDSTMITVECIDELADFVGRKQEVAVITERAMNGELDFAMALTERVALLKGLPETVLRQAYDERVTLMPGALALVTTMRAHGAHAVLVSGGFTYFTARVRAALGFHEDYANRLDIENGVLTGRVVAPILGKEAKLATLQTVCARMGLSSDDVLAIGDGANDLPMLLAAGLGVAYHAKPAVRAQTRARLNHTDLSALLYVQGYRQSEIL